MAQGLAGLARTFPASLGRSRLGQKEIRCQLWRKPTAQCEQHNLLHVVTARTEQGAVAGYHVSFVNKHFHYKDQGLFGFTDMYFTRPELRTGGLGAKLLIALEQSWRERGVVKGYLSHKVAHDRSELFRSLGWQPCDIVYSKVIE